MFHYLHHFDLKDPILSISLEYYETLEGLETFVRQKDFQHL